MILQTFARMIKDSATCLASIGETNWRYAALSLKARTGLMRESKKAYLNSFLITNAEQTDSAAYLAIYQ